MKKRMFASLVITALDGYGSIVSLGQILIAPTPEATIKPIVTILLLNLFAIGGIWAIMKEISDKNK